MLKISGYNGIAIDLGQTVNLTAEQSGLENVKSVAYLWSTGATTASISYKGATVGTSTLSCKATITFEDDTTTEENASVSIEVKDVLIITGYTEEIEINTPVTLSADFTTVDEDSKHTITYLWSTGATTKSIDFESDVEGSFEVTCTAKITPADTSIQPYNTEDSQTVVVKDNTPQPDIDPLNRIFFVHPLPERNEASVAVPYWVLDEINRAIKEGIDWSKPKANGLKYDKGIQSIVDAITTYGAALVRGSRNGITFKLDTTNLPGPVPTSAGL